MAVATFFTELPAVDIIILVATVTIGGLLDLFVHTRGVTCVTGCARMSAIEGETGLFRMIKRGLPPRRRGMAGAAFVSETAGMYVLAGMTSGAGLRKLSVARRLAVASDTSRFGMSATKWKAALLGMVEVFSAPGFGLMAVGTDRSEPARMGIVDGMTVVARLRCSLVLRGNVASGTSGLLVRAGQWIFRLVVIESRRSPIRLFVALAAIVFHRIAMNVVFTMAGDAILGRVAPGDVGLMAVVAGRRLVSTAKRKFRLTVIECGFAQAIDIRPSTLVIWMATSTLPIQRQRISTMKTLALFKIASHQFMTIQTKAALCVALEGHMAGAAVLLELCVPLDELSWHHHSLPINRRRFRGSAD